MAIRVRLGDEVFDIPTVGAANWGEEITLYLVKNAEILATIQGAQDILLTEAPLTNGAINQPINGLSFDTSNLQQVVVDGLITRNFISGTPKVDHFLCEGVYDGADFNINAQYTGTDANVKIDVNSAGQFLYTAESVPDTTSVTIKFRATAIVDE